MVCTSLYCCHQSAASSTPWTRPCPAPGPEAARIFGFARGEKGVPGANVLQHTTLATLGCKLQGDALYCWPVVLLLPVSCTLAGNGFGCANYRSTYCNNINDRTPSPPASVALPSVSGCLFCAHSNSSCAAGQFLTRALAATAERTAGELFC